MLHGRSEPVFQFAFGLAAGPMLVFLQYGRIDHTGDVTGSGQDEFDLAAEEGTPSEDRARRRDMVLARCLVEDGDFHVPE